MRRANMLYIGFSIVNKVLGRYIYSPIKLVFKYRRICIKPTETTGLSERRNKHPCGPGLLLHAAEQNGAREGVVR